jgi:twinkle protein
MRTFEDFGIMGVFKASGETRVLCPQCSPVRKKANAKDLSVNAEKGTFFCHHCTWTGGLTEGEQKTSNPYADQRTKAKTFRKLAAWGDMPELPDWAKEWLKARGITPEIAKAAKLAAGMHDFKALGETLPAIYFPYFRNGELVNVKYRAVAEGRKEFEFEGGCEQILYGLGAVKGSNTVYIVEGEPDCLIMKQCGHWPTVSVPAGGNSTSLAYLESAEPFLKDAVKIVLAGDTDEVGAKFHSELTRRLGVDRCWRVTWPEGCNDANATFLAHGEVGVLGAVEAAEQAPIFGVMSHADIEDELDYLYEHGFERGVSTGWPNIDVLYTVKPSQLTTVTGFPGDGKSAWVDALAVNMARLHGLKIAFFSPENFPYARHAGELASRFIGEPFMDFNDGPPKMGRESYENAKRFGREHYWYIGGGRKAEGYMMEGANTLDSLLQQAKSLVLRHGIHGVVLDPWNAIEHDYPASRTETQYVSESLGKILEFTRFYRVHVWLVAHPARVDEFLEQKR